jgi:hypothetical protein
VSHTHCNLFVINKPIPELTHFNPEDGSSTVSARKDTWCPNPEDHNLVTDAYIFWAEEEALHGKEC